jgi:hypothetical protein
LAKNLAIRVDEEWQAGTGYAAMAADEEREAEAEEWCAGLIEDVADDPGQANLLDFLPPAWYART